MENYESPSWLYNEYVNNNKTITEIALELAVSEEIISEWLTRLNISK